MVSTISNLDTVVQEYLNDNAFFVERNTIASQRHETLPHYKYAITQFTNGTFNLDAFRNELKTLHKERFWGGHAAGVLMELNKLASTHVLNNPEIETHIRLILAGLDAQNLGQRIEQFYHMLLKEKERLLQSKISPPKIAAPGKSAFIISLLAFWNDAAGAPYIYYPSVRLGLAALINAKFIPTPSDIKIDAKGVKILLEADHQAVSRTFNNLSIAHPQLKIDSYWAERFLYWLTEKIQENPTYLKTPIYISGDVEDGVETVLDEPDMSIETLALIEDLPLSPTPEPLLTQLIAELRKHILIEESVVRSIYYSLLNGHVIFTGPPGTGKTELARLIPEILWQKEEQNEGGTQTDRVTRTAYTATLVTATNEWSARTLISSIAPMLNADRVSYRTQHGHLTTAILRNWSYTIHAPAQWEFHGRKRVQAQSRQEPSIEREYQGHWLIIDEFNRAPIDTALGEALTSLSDGEALLVPIDGTYLKLPLPKDFRIIGTLNSFDRSYLNKISEALKRRFAFIEISPPSRAQRTDEQGIVLYKALKRIAHLSKEIVIEEETVEWQKVCIIEPDKSGTYVIAAWVKDHPFTNLFYGTLWPLFEALRVYRQLGTAQAIKLVSQILTSGLLQKEQSIEGWQKILDTAFCDTIADQLQVLLPDELEVLSWLLKYDATIFSEKYNTFLARLAGKQRRLGIHLEALGALVNESGEALLTDEEVEQLLEDEGLQLAPEILTQAFHLEQAPYRLPQLSRRLRIFKAERGL